MDGLPLLDVDWELVSDQDFRNLLAALNFEASYEPRKRELTIRVTLVPELTFPDGGRAPLLSVPPEGSSAFACAQRAARLAALAVPPARHSLHLCTDDLLFRAA